MALKFRGEAAMSTLEDIIDSPENLEVKRALAVKMFIVTLLVKTPAFRRERLQSLAVAMTPSYH